MRAIRYRRRGFKPQTLLTSLVDSKAFPADELCASPARISFVMSLRLIRDEWMWAAASNAPGAIPRVKS
jgi:hypothetical protein